MANPKNVNPQKFKVDRVLYNYSDFSVCYGTWTPNNTKALAMRWNNGDDGKGYPKTFGNPQWFIVSDDLKKQIISGLLNNSNISQNEYQDILDVLKTL